MYPELNDDGHIYLAPAAGDMPPVAGRVLTFRGRDLAITVFVPAQMSWGVEVVSIALDGVTYAVVSEAQDVTPGESMHLPIQHPEMVPVLVAVQNATERLFLRVLSGGGSSCDDVIDILKVKQFRSIDWVDQPHFYQLDSWFPQFPLNPYRHPEGLTHG